MRRREFISLVGSALVFASPGEVQAQQEKPLIGFLSSLREPESKHLAAGFQRGLAEHGFIAGQNVAIEYRWAGGNYDRMPGLAADIVKLNLAVLVASGGPHAALAAKAATRTIPIVFSLGVDPVKLGMVSSLNRPEANITGVHMFTTGLEAKRFGLLHELMSPGVAIAMLYNPNNLGNRQVTDVQEAAGAVKRPLTVVPVTRAEELEQAYARIAESKAGALLVASDPMLSGLRHQLIALSARHAIPAAYQLREFAEAGGLMSYGTNLVDTYRQVGSYVGRVLKGATPSELPVVQSSKFELVINLKTAKRLGLSIPPGVLAIADEVIE
jgi:putative ABC transport system substrate-binding protein